MMDALMYYCVIKLIVVIAAAEPASEKMTGM